METPQAAGPGQRAQPVEQDGRWFLIANLYGQDDYGKKGLYTGSRPWNEAMTEIHAFLGACGKNTRLWRFL